MQHRGLQLQKTPRQLPRTQVGLKLLTQQASCTRLSPSVRATNTQRAGEIEWAEVGVITGSHGLRGEVRVKPLTDSAEERFQPGTRSWLQRKTSVFEQDKKPEQVEIQFVRSVTSRGKLGYLLKLDCVSSREEADELKGTTILVKTSDRKDLGGDSEFYVQDLLGLEVRFKSEGGECTVIGTVVDLYDGTGVHDTLDIELTDSFVAQTLQKSNSNGEEGEEEKEEQRKEKRKKKKKTCVLVPFVRDIVPVVNAQEGFCEITPPEGLLEACMYKKKK